MGLFNLMLQLRGGVCTGFIKPHVTVKRVCMYGAIQPHVTVKRRCMYRVY
jgi:hypothetical protein